jgi:hypothetical protein
MSGIFLRATLEQRQGYFQNNMPRNEGRFPTGESTGQRYNRIISPGDQHNRQIYDTQNLIEALFTNQTKQTTNNRK